MSQESERRAKKQRQREAAGDKTAPLSFLIWCLERSFQAPNQERQWGRRLEMAAGGSEVRRLTRLHWETR